MPSSEPFAEVVISVCVTSKEAIPEYVTTLMGTNPTSTPPPGVPCAEGGGDERYRTYFQSATRFEAPQTGFQQISRYLFEHLQPFAADPEALAELRRVSERVTVICSIRTSRNCAIMPISLETLQLLVLLGFEFQIVSSTRAEFRESPNEAA